MSFGRRIGLAALVLTGAALPFGGSAVWHDLAAMKALGTVARELPRTTEVLRAETAVERGHGSCLAVVAKVLASELDVQEIRAFHGGRFVRERDGSDAEFLAWSSLGAFWIQSTTGEEAPRRLPSSGSRQLPKLVQSLLSSWAILPDGVQRVVLFRVGRIDSVLDPRCLGV
jgi:hypothetical protein